MITPQPSFLRSTPSTPAIIMQHIQRILIVACLWAGATSLFMPAMAQTTNDATESAESAEDSETVEISPVISLDLTEFARIPILVDGRKMPMQSFARDLMLRFAGRTTFNGKRSDELNQRFADISKELIEQIEAASQETDKSKITISDPEYVAALQLDPTRTEFDYEVMEPNLPLIRAMAAWEPFPVERVDSLTWLSRVIFDPSTTIDDKVFLINNPEVLEAIGVSSIEKRRLYSFSQLRGGIQRLMELAAKANSIENNKRALVDQDFIRVAAQVMTYYNLTRTFDFARASQNFMIGSKEVKAHYGLDEDKWMFSYFDIFRIRKQLQVDVLQMLNKDPELANMSPMESWQLQIVDQLKRFDEQQKMRSPFDVIPVNPHAGSETWSAPSEIISVRMESPQLEKEVVIFGNMSEAFQAEDQEAFDKAVSDHLAFVEAQTSIGGKNGTGFWVKGGLGKIQHEITYNNLNLLFWCKVLYLLAFIIGFFGMLAEKTPTIRRIAVLLVLVAIVLHVGAVVFRMYIMGRPPITNLYATFIFVALACAILAMVAEWFTRVGVGAMSAGFIGWTLLMFSNTLALDGDTMGEVQAVLDSQFWLGTHVVAINLGYAGVWLAGVIGHVYLILKIFGARKKVMKETFRYMLGILGFGLTFSFLGTMLGGVWGDQSWGRFWGWDPKENGAILIVLWCAIIYHARLGGMIREVGAAALAALGNVVVMLAWLGVNLLSVGLHSYGFTSGMAGKLFAYVLAELIFVFVALILIKIFRGDGPKRGSGTPATA